MEARSVRTAETARPQEELFAYGGLVLATLGWASAFVAGKVALAELTPLTVASFRYVLATLMFLPFVRQRPPHGWAQRALWPLLIMVVCGGALYPWLFLAALHRTSATNTSLLIALNPIFTILFAPLIGEHLTRRRVVGVLIALLGATIVITRGQWRDLSGLALNAGDILAVLAAACWATFNLASHTVVALLTPAMINLVVYAIGAVSLTLIGASEHPWAQLAAASPAALGSVGLMALFSSVLAGQLFLMGVRALGVSRTVVFIYLVPVLTAILSAVILGDRLDAAQFLGGAAVLGGVYWSNTRAGREPAIDDA